MKNYIAGALLLLLTVPALADSPSYNYAQVNWQTIDIDDGILNADGDGFGVGGSVELGSNWHLVASYNDFGFDFGVDYKELVAGFGFHTDIASNMSFFAELAYVKAEVSQSVIGSFDESGAGARIGLRSNVTENIELEGGISYVDYGDGADGTAVSGAAWYKFSDTFAVGLTAGFDEDATAYGVGARLYF